MKRFLKVLIGLLLTTTTAMGQTTLPTAWNFSSPTVSSPPNGWTFGIGLNGTGGLTYSGGQNSVGGDNTAARFDATGEFIKISFAEKPGALSYYIKGTGIPPAASFTGAFAIQESPDDVTWSNLRSFSTASPIPGGNMTNNKFTDVPASTTRFIRFFYTEKLSGSNVALDSVLVRAAPPSSGANIVVKVGTTALVNPSTYVVGNQQLVNFLIQNTGTQQTLQIDSIKLSGPAAGDYSFNSLPSAVGANQTGQLPMNFIPGADGSRRAVLRIYNNVPDQNPYEIQLYGIGGNLATEPENPPAGIQTSEVRPFGFRVSLGLPSTPPERYLLIQTTNAPLSALPLDGTTYRTGDRIGNGVVVYVGDSVVSNFRPRYILASTGYNLEAFSFNGPAGFENYLTSTSTATSVQTPGKQPGNYYAGIDPSLSSFITDLRDKINPRDTIFYSAYAPRLVSTWLERDTTLGRKVVNCVYTGLAWIYEGAFNWWSGQGSNPATLTREHTFAQSWMPSNNNNPNWPTAPNGKEYPEFNDMHHLFPAHQTNANARRGNNPFGVVVNATYTSPTGEGKLGTNAGGTTVYEPRNEHKGDAARALMYMSTSYHLVNGNNWRFPANQSPAVMMQWHQQDPPSALEIARHELIFSLQKNRNPFIDHPEWASQINFANMAYLPTSVSPLEFRNALATWPNPGKDLIHLDATLVFEPSMKYDWVDVRGSVQGSGSLEAAMTQIRLPEEKGMYFLRIHSKRGTFVTRVVKD